ncbi:MAG: histone deacetylase family protein [Actinomycetota bacterium]
MMRHVRSDVHRRHEPNGEIYGGELVRPFECPERWDHVATALDDAGWGEPTAPEPIEVEALTEVHDPAFVEFLSTAWDEWTAAGYSGDMIPTCFPGRRMRQHEPDDIDGRLGYFAFAAETSISSGTWEAALESAAIARTAQRLVSGGDPAAFALCRPPGHHAAQDYFGGYCYLNSAAIAAQGFRNDGAQRVAVLDVDFHHGNGTQDIFWERGDVFFASLHGDPRHEFPHFLGFADETGAGAGSGATANYPLLPGTDADTWLTALDDALSRISNFGADALVVSLGVDTFEQDPISSFRLGSDDFTRYGRRIGALGLPTVYCMEGGYAVAEIGINTVNALTGHLEGAS